MTDLLMDLGRNPATRKVLQSLLPLPLPQALWRADGPMVERPLEGRTVVFGAGPDASLIGAVARVLGAAGATPHLVDEGSVEAFRAEGEAHGRPPRLLNGDADAVRADALVFDASGITSGDGLRALYDFFHPWMRRLNSCARVVVLGRPLAIQANAEAAASQRALEGFVRSLAKELGRRGSTAQLVTVDAGAEDRLDAPLRFLLGPRSAFVSGQRVDVSAIASAPKSIDWVRPLAGKLALVTGAARGIGQATAAQLAAEGAHVLCLDRPEDDAAVSKVAREVGGTPVLCDVSADDAAERLIAALDGRKLDVVVHNAGVTRDKTLARMDEARWDQAIGINLTAVARVTDALAEEHLAEGARVVCLSSVAGIAGNMGQTNYAASKAGIIGLVEHLAEELSDRGITVNAIAPGFIETRLTAAIPVMIREAGRRLSNLGQGGQPRDVAAAITFLSTPAAAGITGTTLRVCGGALIGA